jgi:hypothetical protein
MLLSATPDARDVPYVVEYSFRDYKVRSRRQVAVGKQKIEFIRKAVVWVKIVNNGIFWNTIIHNINYRKIEK